MLATIPAQADISKELEKKVNNFLEERRNAKVQKNPHYQKEGGWRLQLTYGSMTQQSYYKSLKNIGELAKKENAGDLILLPPLKLQLVKLAKQVSEPGFSAKTKELSDWYGSFDYDIPNELFEKKWGKGGIVKELGLNIKTHKEFLKQQAKKTVHGKGQVEKLHKEHATVDYLPAWKFWLMAPPSKEGGFMGGRINKALQKIGESSVIPLLVEAMKNDVNEWRDQKSAFYIQKQTVQAYLNLICSMPGTEALNALLVVNRYAIENNLNGDDYYKSITRHIIRRLASRRAYADQLINPKMKATIERQGYNEKPEDIPLTDDLWKKYKPLLEVRLGAKTDKTPRADIYLIQSALEIMPKG